MTTDGFLFPNAELERRGLMQRKGFPESYDRRALLRFVSEVKAGRDEVAAPVYSHLTYDILPDEQVVVHRPDVLIVEGLNVMQPPWVRSDGSTGMAVSDFFDFSVYVDAREEDIESWYVERFLRLRQTAFADPSSYFHRYASAVRRRGTRHGQGHLARDQRPQPAREHPADPLSRATLVLRKGSQPRGPPACGCASSEGASHTQESVRRAAGSPAGRRPDQYQLVACECDHAEHGEP